MWDVKYPPNRDTYRCKNCGFKADRHLVGAINIYMKALGLNQGDLDLTNIPNKPTILDETWVYGYDKLKTTS